METTAAIILKGRKETICNEQQNKTCTAHQDVDFARKKSSVAAGPLFPSASAFRQAFVKGEIDNALCIKKDSPCLLSLK